MLKKKKIVAYCRVSTLEQKRNGYGIDIQIRDATIFAQQNGVFIERFYKDEGESGVKEDRKALKELMRDCRKGRIATVILPSLDRLSREVRIAENLFHEFNKLGVRVLIADMPQYNGERKDVLIRQILEAIAEENRREIIERLGKGRQERVRKGLFPGGNVPYGYMREHKIVMVHPREAEIIREIYSLAVVKRAGQQIADELNARGYVRRNGQPWTQRQVCRILGSRKLYGEGQFRYGITVGENKTMVILEIETNAG